MSLVLVIDNNRHEYTIDTERYVVVGSIALTVGQSEDSQSSTLVVASMVHLEMFGKRIGQVPPTPDWDNALLARDVDDWPRSDEWYNVTPSYEAIAARAKLVSEVIGVVL